MFQAWRWKIRQAEAACQAGRLEESLRILQDSELRTYEPGQRVVDQLHAAFLQRAQQRADKDDTAGAWRDLETAITLAGEQEMVLTTRSHLVSREVASAERQLASGNALAAISIIDGLERRHVDGERSRAIREAARRIDAAQNLQRCGRFTDAESQLKAAAQIIPGFSDVAAQLKSQLVACAKSAGTCRQLTELLHEAISDSAWSRVVSLADELLEIAPDHRLARDARQRAWREVGHRVSVTQHAPAGLARATPVGVPAPTRHEFPRGGKQPSRFLLWIDAVGGYLVCLADQIVLGQAAPGNSVDVPILGDISRRHAIVRRKGEGYFVDPIQAVRVEGQSITTSTLLSDGDQIELGSTVKLRFRKPHALSSSARLEFVSRHSTSPSADGILLMAESCVLGPRWQNHVVCRNWSADVVLYRQEDELFCRAMDSIEIDGQWFEGRGPVGANSRIAGSDFALSLEYV